MEEAELKKTKEIIEEVQRCMARVMDDCEMELGDSPRWKYLRSRILNNFGARGLSGKISEIAKNADLL